MVGPEGGGGKKGGVRTKNEFLSRGEHVEGEGDFVLIAFALEPAEEGGEVEHFCFVVVVVLRWGLSGAERRRVEIDSQTSNENLRLF